MGVAISYKLAIEEGRIKSTLTRTENVAKNIKKNIADTLGISFEIRKAHNFLAIDIEGCETLVFDFKYLSDWENQGKEGWNYKWACLESLKGEDTTGEHYERYPEQRLLWCADFCKTQFATSLFSHQWVSEILRSIASYCNIALVNDEGDYYHTGNIEDSLEAIEENGKLIELVGGLLKGKGFEVVQRGKTTLKPTKKK